jgi:ABC-type bacteriocin/lantibiotic exporter with double-glycine peptidase domain
VPRLNGVKPSRQWIVYSLIRLGIFAVLLALLLVLQVNPFVAAFGAAAVAFCISYIFLKRRRDEVAKTMVRAKASGARSVPERDLDNDIENEALDRMENREPPA